MGPTRRIPYSKRKRPRISRHSPSRSPTPSSSQEDQAQTPSSPSPVPLQDSLRRHSSRSQKAQLIMPVGRISSYLKSFVDRSGVDAAVYLAAAIQYFVVEVLYGAISYMYQSQLPQRSRSQTSTANEQSPRSGQNVSTKELKNKRITPDMLHKSIRNDPELGSMFIDRRNYFPTASYEKGLRKSKKRSKSKGKGKSAVRQEG